MRENHALIRALVNEAVGRVNAAKAFRMAVNGHAHRAPVIIWRHVNHPRISRYATLSPVRLVNDNGAVIDELTHDRHVAQGHPADRAEIENGTCLRRCTTGVNPCRIAPPIPRIAMQVYIGGRFGIGDALNHASPTISVTNTMMGQARDVMAARVMRCRNLAMTGRCLCAGGSVSSAENICGQER